LIHARTLQVLAQAAAPPHHATGHLAVGQPGDQCAALPDKAALVFFGRVFTYQDVLHKAERLAARLATLGVQKGDRVVLNMQNCPQLVIAHFAILRANAVVVPVNPMNRAEELKHYITDPDAKVAITTSDLAAELAARQRRLPEGQRLAHLIVTHFTDAFDGNVSGPDAPPEAWRRLAAHPPRAASAGRRGGAFVARRAGQRAAAARSGRRACRPVDSALHQRHHRPAQGLHAHARQRHAQRGGQRHVGQRTPRT
jgi:acyl-CoA synthetase (AMP-forming)/AMP-acid ligase II